MDKTIQKKLNDFFSQYILKKYKKGDLIISPNVEPPGVCYLAHGAVKQYTISVHGNEQILNIFKTHSFFPMIWAINYTPNIYFFEALNDVELYIAPKEAVIMFLKQDPEILYDLLSRIYRGMSGFFTRIEYLLFGSAYHKVIFAILNLTNRFGDKKDTSYKTTLYITQKEIASYIGLTKETISRQCRILKNKGLIYSKNSSFIIADIKKIEEELLKN